MQSIKVCGIIVFFMTLLNGIASAAMITINPSNYAAGTDLGNPYPKVTFTTAQGYVDFVDFDPTPTLVETIHLTGPDLGSIFAQGPYMAGVNHVNWASDPLFSGYEVFKATFSLPVDFVSMTYFPDDTDTGVLGVFDRHGNLLSHQYLRSNETFALSYTADNKPIGYILASFDDPGYLGALSFNVKPHVHVPEPETLALISLSLLGIGIIRGRITRRPK